MVLDGNMKIRGMSAMQKMLALSSLKVFQDQSRQDVQQLLPSKTNFTMVIRIRLVTCPDTCNLPSAVIIMIITRKGSLKLPPPPLMVEGTPLMLVSSVKYLEIQINSDLSWSHVANLCNKQGDS